MGRGKRKWELTYKWVETGKAKKERKKERQKERKKERKREREKEIKL